MKRRLTMKNEKKGIKIMRIIFAVIDFIKKIFYRAHGENENK